MSHRRSRYLAPLLAGIAALGVARSARALECVPLLEGRAIRDDVVVVCHHCDVDVPPLFHIEVLESANAATAERTVEEVERVELVNGGLGLRYRVSEPFAEGSYVLYSLAYGVKTIATDDLGPPEIPSARLVGYEMSDDALWGRTRIAKVEIEGVNGMLVLDEGEPDDDPMRSLQNTFRTDDATEIDFRFGADLCPAGNSNAEYGERTRVRFGTLAPSGEFSGWSEWLALHFPSGPGRYVTGGPERLYLVDPETSAWTLARDENGNDIDTGGCSLSVAGRTGTGLGPWGLLGLLGLFGMGRTRAGGARRGRRGGHSGH